MTDGTNEIVAQQLVLKAVPKGLTRIEDFEVKDVKLPPVSDGQILVKANYIGVEAALRLIVRDSDEFLFRVKTGDIVRGTCAGIVVESRNPSVSIGDAVLVGKGVQDYILCDPDEFELCDLDQAPLDAWLGGFGVSGLTAYFAVFSECKPQPGQTVLINGAAGAVGSIAGQLCKLAGAKVIGLTSSPQKCEWLETELGYDVAINYKDEGWLDRVREHSPERLDVIFDNVGGDLLNQSLTHIGMNGTVLLCGSTSQYSAENMSGPSNYIWLGTMRAKMQGFVIFDYESKYPEARSRMSSWMKNRKLKFPSHEISGSISDFPRAFRGLYEGENLGKMLLRIE